MTTPLLSAHHLSRTFEVAAGPFSGSARVTAVSDVSLEIRPGTSIGIAGESGCGKSTLAKLLTGLLPPSAGEVRFLGKGLASLTGDERRRYRRTVQMVFQDPFSSLNPRLRIGRIIAEPLEIHRLATGRGVRVEVERLLETVGLPPAAADRYPHEFSGGQRQRIGIARALAVNPSLLIADEPVSALDLSIQAQIINLLQELRERFSLALLLIAHDLSVIRHLCDTVAIMYLGKIVEFGPSSTVLSAMRHPYTEALMAAVPRLEPSLGRPRIILHGDLPSPVAPPAGCPFHPRCPHGDDLCRREVPPLAHQAPDHSVACHHSDRIFGKL